MPRSPKSDWPPRWTNEPSRAGAIVRGRVLAINHFADWEICKAWWQVTIQRGLCDAQRKVKR